MILPVVNKGRLWSLSKQKSSITLCHAVHSTEWRPAMASYDSLLLSHRKAPCTPMKKVSSPLALSTEEKADLSQDFPQPRQSAQGRPMLSWDWEQVINTAFCFLSCSLPLLATYLPNGLQIFESYKKGLTLQSAALEHSKPQSFWVHDFHCCSELSSSLAPTEMLWSEPDYSNRSKSDFKSLLVLPEYIPDLPQRIPLCSPGTRSNQYSEIGSKRLGYLMEHLHSPVKNPNTVGQRKVTTQRDWVPQKKPKTTNAKWCMRRKHLSKASLDAKSWRRKNKLRLLEGLMDQRSFYVLPAVKAGHNCLWISIRLPHSTIPSAGDKIWRKNWEPRLSIRSEFKTGSNPYLPEEVKHQTSG